MSVGIFCAGLQIEVYRGGSAGMRASGGELLKKLDQNFQ
jgi:hypothetical protein